MPVVVAGVVVVVGKVVLVDNAVGLIVTIGIGAEERMVQVDSTIQHDHAVAAAIDATESRICPELIELDEGLRSGRSTEELRLTAIVEHLDRCLRPGGRQDWRLRGHQRRKRVRRRDVGSCYQPCVKCSRSQHPRSQHPRSQRRRPSRYSHGRVGQRLHPILAWLLGHRVCRGLQVRERVTAIRSGRRPRLIGIQFAVVVQIQVDNPALDSGFASVALTVRVQVVELDTVNPAERQNFPIL